MTAAPKLIGGPYKIPRCKVGKDLHCEERGDVPVDGITDAPIPWPYTLLRPNGLRGGGKSVILCGGLKRAVETESRIAVAHHWGVSRKLVSRWRKLLGVEGEQNPGSKQLWKDLYPLRLEPHRNTTIGAKPGLARLTPEQRAEIRRRVAGGEDRIKVAAELGISRQHAGKIAKGGA